MQRVVFLIVAVVIATGLVFGASTDLPQTVVQPTLSAGEQLEACSEVITLLSITFGGPWSHDCSSQIEANFLMVSTSDSGSRLFITNELLDVNPCGESLSMGPHEDEGVFVYLCGYGEISRNQRDGETYSFFIASI